MIPEKIPEAPVSAEAMCAFASRWTISEELAFKLAVMASYLPYPLQVISGYRTDAQQDALRAEGRPATRNDLSTHLSCPATGVDVWTPIVTPVNAVKATVGAAGMQAGLRWGGGSSIDPATGIPSDWNHFDLGPR